MTGSVLDEVLACIARGWSPIPVPFRTKKPVLSGWQHLRITAETAPAYFNGAKQNFGVILGPASHGLADGDMDCAEAIQIAPYFLPKTSMFGRQSAPASHWLYYPSSGFTFERGVLSFDDPLAGKDEKARLCELRVGGNDLGIQTVFPGSVHEEGEVIRWEADSLSEPVRVAGSDLEMRMCRVAAASLTAKHWPAEGRRHEAALALGGVLRRGGWKTPEIRLFVSAVCAAARDPEHKDRAKAAADSAEAIDADRRAYGLPTLSSIIGDKVVNAVVKWLGLQNDVWPAHAQAQDQGDAGPPPSWPEPQALPEGLLPVAPFNTGFLPLTLEGWVEDISERMQCPPDFIAVTAVAALGAVLGRRIGVRPQRNTDWSEVCSFWGCVVGRPGWLKSPSMAEAMRPLLRLESAAQETNEEQRHSYEQEMELWKLRKTARERAALGELKKNRGARPDITEEKPEEPQAKRFVTNDSSYEALGQLLVANPTGILVFRDELVSLLRTLDREEYAAARGFFMTAWGGKSAYTFDRIIRGRQHIKAAFVGLIGSTQPARIVEYLRRATSASDGNDGLVQRFSLLVWPDTSPRWRDSDEFPDSKAREAAWKVFERFSLLDPHAVKAQFDPLDPLPYLRFGSAAQGLFLEWRTEFEARVRSGDLPEALEGHLAKYRKLVPTLALLDHLADGGEGPIHHDSLKRALAFAGYLETHAKRAYAAAAGNDADTARLILARIRAGDLKDGFKARDIQRHEWSGLTDRERVGKGIELLSDFDWIAPQAAGRNPAGGRPTTLYAVNPRVQS